MPVSISIDDSTPSSASSSGSAEGNEFLKRRLSEGSCVRQSKFAKRSRNWRKEWRSRETLFGSKLKVLVWVTYEQRQFENLFKCEECSRSFQDASKFRKHIRANHTVKRFKCQAQDCLKAFANASSLARHQKIHSN